MSDSTSEHEQYDVLEPAMMKQKQVVEKKEKKVKPGAQKKQSKEDVLKALEEKRKAKEEEKRLEEERKQLKQLKVVSDHAINAMFLPLEAYADGHEPTFDELRTHRAKFMLSAGIANDLTLWKRETPEEAVERKRLWKLRHEEDAWRVQKEQEANRLQPDDEEMTEKKFKALIKSVGWNPTTVELDAVLDQLSAYYIGKLWIESTLWFRARERGMICRV